MDNKLTNSISTIKNPFSVFSSEFDKRAVNLIRKLALDQIQKANSGHPGIALGAAPIIYSIFSNFLHFNVKDPNWKGRDRFVLSAGHGSALLYSTLLYFGYEITINDLKLFRCLNSVTPGHPHYWSVPGIETTTGPLGQGIGNGVGMSLSEQWLSENVRIDQKVTDNCSETKHIFNNFTYVLCSDGCLQEGISYEAMSFAGHHKLKKLIFLYDSNHVQLDGSIDETFSENVKQRVISSGWEYFYVENGDCVASITNAIKSAQASVNDKPKFIEVCTVIGIHSENANFSKVHGAPLTTEDYKKTILDLGFMQNEVTPFWIDEVVINRLSQKLFQRTNPKYEEFENKLDKLYKSNRKFYDQFIMRETSCNFADILENTKKYNQFEPVASRDFVGEMLNYLSKSNQNLIGGSADLSCSTRIKGADGIYNIKTNKCGREIKFGVRENAMVSIVTGINLFGCQNSFGSSFLSFFDNAKLSTRLAAMIHVRTLTIYSHDSIFIGEDGETHQPVEQIGNLRSIPELETWRPYNREEAAASLNYNFTNSESKANIIITTRQKYYQISTTLNAVEIQKGGYVIQYESLNKPPKVILFGSGSDVEIALRVAAMLEGLKIPTRVISVPCLTRFISVKNENYLSEITYKNEPELFVIESANCNIWYKLIPFSFHVRNVFCVSKFGKSASENDLRSYFDLSPESIFQSIWQVISPGTMITKDQINAAILCNKNLFSKTKQNPISQISKPAKTSFIKPIFSLFRSLNAKTLIISKEKNKVNKENDIFSKQNITNNEKTDKLINQDLNKRERDEDQISQIQTNSTTQKNHKSMQKRSWFTKFSTKLKEFKLFKK